jgi:hypothetical protein
MNTQLANGPMDIAGWAQLARKNHDEYLERRSGALAALIATAPSDIQAQLMALQEHIDIIHTREKTTIGACLKLSNMMWDIVLGENGMVEHLDRSAASGDMPGW